MSLPAQLLLSDLLGRRVRSERGDDHGLGLQGWMHPPVHRLLGWVSRPSALSQRRWVWRLDQLHHLAAGEAFVRGDFAETDPATIERLPTLLGATLFSANGQPLARLVDAVVELRSGRILEYLVARSDPRLPGSSRWRLSPDRIVDQRPGEVFSALRGLEDLPLARASLREDLLRRSRQWRQQLDSGSSRWREQWQQASDRLEQRLEGWLEEPPWDGPERWRQQDRDPHAAAGPDLWPEQPLSGEAGFRPGGGPGPSAAAGVAAAEAPEARGGLDPLAPPQPAERSDRFSARAGAAAPAEPEPWEDPEGWGAEGGEQRSAPGSRRPLGARPLRRPPPESAAAEEEDPWV